MEQTGIDVEAWQNALRKEADLNVALRAENERLRASLRRIGDWRLDKAIGHLDTLRPFAGTDEDQAWIDRFQGWLLMIKNEVERLMEGDRGSTQGGADV